MHPKTKQYLTYALEFLCVILGLAMSYLWSILLHVSR